MESPHDPPPPPDLPADAGRRLARAERVLACFGKALGHDLPNQLVALQGILQILELEEGARLSPEGRDYLRRLAAVGRRLQEGLAALKAIGRAAGEAGPAEEVVLADLTREAAAEVKQLCPGRAVTYHRRFQVPAVRTCRRPLQRALVELVRLLVAEAGGEAVHLRLDSRVATDGVELLVGPWPEAGAAEAPAGRPAPEGEGAAAGRLGLALAGELVDACGGRLTAAEGRGRGREFVILVPPPG